MIIWKDNMDPRYRTLHNAIFNAVSWMVPIILSLAFTPYIVHELGTEAYGILALTLAIIGYFTLLDLNLRAAVIKYVAEYHAKGSPHKINEIVGVTMLLHVVLGIVGALGILSLANIMSTSFLIISAEFIPVAYFTFCIASLGFLFTTLLSVLSAIPNGLNNYHITSKVTIVMGSLNTIATVLLLYFGLGLKAIIILNVIISFLGILTYIIIGKRILPGLKLTPVFKLSVAKKVLSFGIFSFLSRLSSLINFQVDRLVAGAVVGVSWVTYYVVPFTLVQRVMTVTFRLGTVIFPVVSELQGKGDMASVADLYLKASRIIAAIATAFSLPLILFGERFLSVWMGAEFGRRGGTIILLLTIALYMDAFTNVPTFVVNGLGRPKISGICSMIAATINLAVIYPLAKAGGIVGVAAAVMISTVCVTPAFVLFVNNRVLGLSITRLIKEAYSRPVIAGVLTALPLLMVPAGRLRSLSELVIIMMVTPLLYFAISSVIGVFSEREKELAYEYLRMIVRRV